ncbi:MAG TPA: sulfotransferase [Asticcacaulis sp.]|nr:sulfotransferase [Asticcacaulis sp.]
MLSQGYSETGNPAQSWLTKAWAAMQQGRSDAAADAAKRALGYDPDNLQAYWLWALNAMEMYRYPEAEAALSEGARRIPDDQPLKVRFLTQRARALAGLGWNGEARRTVLNALKLIEAKPEMADAETLHFLGQSLNQTGSEADALPVLRWSVKLDDRSPAAWFALGESADFMGQADEAEQAFEAAIARARALPVGQTAAHMALARLRRWTPERNHIARLEALTTNNSLDEARRAYALFKEYDDLGETETAWTWLQRGADAARREPVTPFNPAWTKTEDDAQLQAWTSLYPVERFREPKAAIANAQPTRIFIIGLPRSGTTLVERILGAHSMVRPLGELQSFPAAVKVHSGVAGPDLLTSDVIRATADADPAIFARYYNRDLDHVGAECVFTVDKLPRNTSYAGLIRLAFPDARIVHVRRDPMDALFGSYKLHFVARWSYDQDDLADYYSHYRALMTHWRTCLGDGLIDVSLEAIIANPETEIRRLLDACGLPFEAACLSPHKSQGAVSSASSSQVRRPINADGVGAWRRYEAQLEPLRRRLADMGCAS